MILDNGETIYQNGIGLIGGNGYGKGIGYQDLDCSGYGGGMPSKNGSEDDKGNDYGDGKGKGYGYKDGKGYG